MSSYWSVFLAHFGEFIGLSSPCIVRDNRLCKFCSSLSLIYNGADQTYIHFDQFPQLTSEKLYRSIKLVYFNDCLSSHYVSFIKYLALKEKFRFYKLLISTEMSHLFIENKENSSFLKCQEIEICRTYKTRTVKEHKVKQNRK